MRQGLVKRTFWQKIPDPGGEFPAGRGEFSAAAYTWIGSSRIAVTGVGRESAEHDQQYAGRYGRPDRVWNIRRHQSDAVRRRLDLPPTDRESQRPSQGEDEGVERRRVLGQLFARVEREQRDVACCRSGEDSACNALRGRSDEGFQREHFARRECTGHGFTHRPSAFAQGALGI